MHFWASLHATIALACLSMVENYTQCLLSHTDLKLQGFATTIKPTWKIDKNHFYIIKTNYASTITKGAILHFSEKLAGAKYNQVIKTTSTGFKSIFWFHFVVKNFTPLYNAPLQKSLLSKHVCTPLSTKNEGELAQFIFTIMPLKFKPVQKWYLPRDFKECGVKEYIIRYIDCQIAFSSLHQFF